MGIHEPHSGSAFNKDNITLSAIYRRLFRDYLLRLEPNLEPLWPSQQREENESSAQPRVNLPELNKLLSKIEDIRGDAGFGLAVGEEIHPSDYSTLGYLLMNCKTLRQALEFATRYKFVLNPNFDSSLTREQDTFYYRLDAHASEQPYFSTLVELDFSSAVQLARFLVGKNNRPNVVFKRVCFRHAPLTSISQYQRLFGCPVLFECQTNQIELNSEVVDLPIRAANQQIFNMLKRKIERVEKSVYPAQSFSGQVFHFLANNEGFVPDINSTARHFNISTSTLKKRLQQESLNFTAMCDNLKKKTALKLMAEPDILIKEIYMSLEFRSASAFNRAFKRWTGLSPSEYRSQNKGNRHK